MVPFEAYLGEKPLREGVGGGDSSSPLSTSFDFTESVPRLLLFCRIRKVS